jgi:hypothetical protein
MEAVIPAIGPAGDRLYVPMRITGGSLIGIGPEKPVLCGSDFALVNADETIAHDGRFIVGDPAGDVLIWYDGISRGAEGVYDAIIDGQLPGRIPSRLNVRVISTGPDWRSLNRVPLLGVGWFDGVAGSLEFTLLSAIEHDARN